MKVVYTGCRQDLGGAGAFTRPAETKHPIILGMEIELSDSDQLFRVTRVKWVERENLLIIFLEPIH